VLLSIVIAVSGARAHKDGGDELRIHGSGSRSVPAGVVCLEDFFGNVVLSYDARYTHR
jgi:hypothetical protein